MTLGEWLGRSTNCPDPCGGNGQPVDDSDKCFAHDQEADYIQAVEPDCPTWKNGWKCRSESFVANATWLFNKITCGLFDHENRIAALEGTVTVTNWEVQDSNNDGSYEITVTYSDGSVVQETITDTDTSRTNPVPMDIDNNGIIDQVSWDVVDRNGNVIGNEIVPVQEYVDTNNQNTNLSFNNTSRVLTLTQQTGPSLAATIPSGDTDTNTFISAVNGDTNGGLVSPNANNQFIIQRNNGTAWTLQLPSSGGGVTYLASPVTVLNVSRAKTAGDFDSGTVNFNVASVATVPSGATGVILQVSTGVSGNQDRLGQSNGATFAYAHIEAARTTGGITGGNATSSGQYANLISYSDTNFGGNDNDNSAYPLVGLNGTRFAYRAKIRWGGNNTGTDTGITRIRVVGFTL